MRRSPDPDLAAGPRVVIDEKRAAEGFAEILADHARHDVGRSGGSERHDDLDGSSGIACRDCLLHPKSGRNHRAHREAGRAQDLTARRTGESLAEHNILPNARTFLETIITSADRTVDQCETALQRVSFKTRSAISSHVAPASAPR